MTPLQHRVHAPFTPARERVDMMKAQRTYPDERAGTGLIVWLLVAVLADVAIAGAVLGAIFS